MDLLSWHRGISLSNSADRGIKASYTFIIVTKVIMDNSANEFIDSYFECFQGNDKSFLFLRLHPSEDIIYATILTKNGEMFNDMYISNPDTVRVKGEEFEYACIQNKSLELDGEYGEADYDMFMHVISDDAVDLLYTPDINNSTALSRKLTRYERLVTPKDFE